jgi:hypothetical protein
MAGCTVIVVTIRAPAMFSVREASSSAPASAPSS